MSIKVMSWVWDNADVNGTELIVLLALADRCDDDGKCFPGVKYIAQKARIKPRSAQQVIKNLEDQGHLRRVIGKGIDTRHGRTNLYMVLGYRYAYGIEKAPDGVSSDTGVHGDTPQGVHGDAPQGVHGGAPYSSVGSSGYPKAFTPNGVSNDVAAPDGTAQADATLVDTGSTGSTGSNESVSIKENDGDASRDTDVKQGDKEVKDSPAEPTEKPETEHQRRIRVLGEVAGIPPAPGDYGLYGRIYKHLLKCGLEEADWPAYVAWVRWKANNGNWDFSIKTLQTGGRVSAYLAEVEQRRPVPTPAPEPEAEPEQELTDEEQAALHEERRRIVDSRYHEAMRRRQERN